MRSFAQLPLLGFAEQSADRAATDRDSKVAAATPPAASTAPKPAPVAASPCAPKKERPRHKRPQAAAAEPGVERLLTFAEAGRILGISLRQFRRLVDRGIVAYVRVSERAPRVRPSELNRFMGAAVVKHSEGSQ